MPNSFTGIGGWTIGLRDNGSLTDAASITVQNNGLSTLSTQQASLTLNVDLSGSEIPNFAVEISAGVDCTVTVQKTVGSTSTVLNYATAAGNEIKAGKFYQLTCVGSCWTIAEFEAPA